MNGGGDLSAVVGHHAPCQNAVSLEGALRTVLLDGRAIILRQAQDAANGDASALMLSLSKHEGACRRSLRDGRRTASGLRRDPERVTASPKDYVRPEATRRRKPGVGVESASVGPGSIVVCRHRSHRPMGLSPRGPLPLPSRERRRSATLLTQSPYVQTTKHGGTRHTCSSWPGVTRPSISQAARWMPGSSPGMTVEGVHEDGRSMRLTASVPTVSWPGVTRLRAITFGGATVRASRATGRSMDARIKSGHDSRVESAGFLGPRLAVVPQVGRASETGGAA